MPNITAGLRADWRRWQTTTKSGRPTEYRRDIEVVIHFVGDVSALEALGLRVSLISGDRALGFIGFAEFEQLAHNPQVLSIKKAGNVQPHLDRSVPAINVPIVWQSSPGYKGAGVIVAVVDSGIDIAHANFRKADGTTRILRLWDQSFPNDKPLPPGATKPNSIKFPNYNGDRPLPVNYGALYTKEALDTILKGPPMPPSQLPGIEPDDDQPGHGTHVMGIAAGNGIQADGCHPSGVYVGVAPEADLVFVKLKGHQTSFLLHALRYIVHFAATASNFADNRPRPVVINCSQGQIAYTGGARILVEDIDDLLKDSTSRVIVASAGNDGDSRREAAFSIPAGGSFVVAFQVIKGDPRAIEDRSTDTIEITYSSAAALTVSLQSPRRAGTIGPLGPGTADDTQVLDDHEVTISSSATPDPGSGRREISIAVSPAASTGKVLDGIWTISLTETAGQQADVQASIHAEDKDLSPRFLDVTNKIFESAVTITSPARGASVIAVANFHPDTGQLQASSGRGPAGAPPSEIKPDLAAPGMAIFAPRSHARGADACSSCSVDFYVYNCGTSMSAPHVAGVVALMLERNKTLTWSQVRAILKSSAKAPNLQVPPVVLPNNGWGAGIVDAGAAVFLATPSSAPASGAGAGVEVPDAPPMEPDPDEPFGLNPIPFSQVRPLWPMLPGFAQRTRSLNDLMAASRAFSLAMALVSTHVDEVRHLINNNRRVATVWRRHGGPALVRYVLAAPLQTHLVLPERVAGHNIRALFDRLLAILERYGGARLRIDSAHYRWLLLALPGSQIADLERLLVDDVLP